ncbi:hypothetical protein B0T19DRAFT_435166 [Cercophora scortea]|uniref:Uncharacterized protein n=1 Tax=Cercophora scortea TaxID=314031 RepID=A0AAE0M3B5_9PEZI|nr:hypothetical protein B0T19DRAFT_435166 [Cercophora scortea]
MASSHLPGSYPDDSAPVTPMQEVEEPTRQRNKLRKPNDPRNHQQTDSGVGWPEATEPERNHSSNFNEPQTQRSNFSEAVGGGLYSREGTALPAPQYQSQPQPQREYPGQEDTAHSRPAASAAAVPAGPVESTPIRSLVAENTKEDRLASQGTVGQQHTSASDKSTNDASGPPYWGHLPKSSEGGIYNSVTGHGSAGDDHADHHHMPESGGVYNTVTGHGSSDEESRRHDLSRSSDKDGNGTISSTDAVLNAPLAGIPHEKQTRFEGTETSRTQPRAVDPIHHPKSSTHHRAFPLTSGTSDNHHATGHSDPQTRSHDEALLPGAIGGGIAASELAYKPYNERVESETQHQHGATAHHHDATTSDPRNQDALFAGAGGLGAGIAASDLADRHNSGDQHHTSSATSHQHKRLSKDVSHESKDTGRKQSHDDAPSGEKKHHGILGLFHRHKDDKTQKEAPAPHHHKDEITSEHHKKEAAVGAAAGAGVLGAKHTHNENSQTQPTSSALSTENPNQYAGIPRVGDNYSPSPSAPESHGKPTAAAGAGVAAGLGAYELSHKHGSSHLSQDAAASAQQVADRTSASAYENPREPPSTGLLSHPVLARGLEPSTGDYNVQSSGVPPGIRTNPGSVSGPTTSADQGRSHSDAGPYNVLSSGTPSGVKIEPHGRHSLSHPATHADSQDESDIYRHLKSGTVSGVNTTHSATGPTPPPKDFPVSSTNSPNQYDTKPELFNNNSQAQSQRFVAVPIIAHHRHQEQNHDTEQQQASTQTAFPTSEAAKHMSPEVLPESYRASAPRSGPSSGTGAPLSSNEPPYSAVSSHQYPQTSHHQQSVLNPALAAANGAWASASAPSGSAGHAGLGHAPVIHKCEHCGKDNDITPYFTRNAQ